MMDFVKEQFKTKFPRRVGHWYVLASSCRCSLGSSDNPKLGRGTLNGKRKEHLCCLPNLREEE